MSTLLQLVNEVLRRTGQVEISSLTGAQTPAIQTRDFLNETYFEMLGYSIYITNILPAQCTAENIFELYKLRWNIEIIFKSWKSCFSLNRLIHRSCKNATRVKCIIYLMLLYISLFHVLWWKHCEAQIQKQSPAIQLSILKMSAFFFRTFLEWRSASAISSRESRWLSG